MSFPSQILLSLAISFTIVYFIIPKIIKVSRIKMIFDEPNHRSAATEVTPSLGGIAIFAGFIISLIISTDTFDFNELKYLIAGITCMFVIGLKDDIIGFSARKKFIIEIIMAVYLVTLGHYRITNLHGIFGLHEISYAFGAILSVITIVGLINAVNLIDGIDGLASGVCILISVVYAFLFLAAGDYLSAMVCFSLTGSLIAFFLYNVFGQTNKIFMGDTGSLVLGTIIAILTIRFNELIPVKNDLYSGMPAISLALVIVPVVDTLRVFAIRILQGKSPFTPDKNHIHHALLRLTDSHLISSLIIISVNALLILFALSSVKLLGNANLLILLLFLGFILAAIPSLLLKLKKKPLSEMKRIESAIALLIFTNKSIK